MNVPLSTTGIEVIPQGNERKSLLFQNNDATINVFIKKTRPGEAVATSTDYDVRLTPGAGFSLNTNDDGAEAVQERWTAVAASGTPTLTLFESKVRKYS